MNELDRYIQHNPFLALVVGIFAIRLMPELEFQRLARALGRTPDWNDCLHYQHEKGRHEEFLRLQGRNLIREKEEEDREKIRRFVWGSDTEKP